MGGRKGHLIWVLQWSSMPVHGVSRAWRKRHGFFESGLLEKGEREEGEKRGDMFEHEDGLEIGKELGISGKQRSVASHVEWDHGVWSGAHVIRDAGDQLFRFMRGPAVPGNEKTAARGLAGDRSLPFLSAAGGGDRNFPISGRPFQCAI